MQQKPSKVVTICALGETIRGCPRSFLRWALDQKG